MAASSRPPQPTLPPGTSLFKRALNIALDTNQLGQLVGAEGDCLLYPRMFDKLVKLINKEKWTEVKSILDQRPDWLDLQGKIIMDDDEVKTLSITDYMCVKLCEHIDDADQAKAKSLVRINPKMLLRHADRVIHRQPMYDLCLMSHDTIIEAGKLYLREIGGHIAYTVITPTGEVARDIVIESLSAPQPFTLDALNGLKYQINAVALKAGHAPCQVYKNYTPYQLAYAEGDPEMCAMLKEYFEEACGSKEADAEMQRQEDEKFSVPAGTPPETAEQKSARFAAKLAPFLQPIIQAITDEPFGDGNRVEGKYPLSDATRTAITNFENAFIESQPKVIEQGVRFDLETLNQIYAAYARAAGAGAGRWNYDYKKCALFEDAVLPFVLNYAAKNDAQRFSQGLYYLQDKGKAFKRRTALRSGEGEFYAILHRVSPDFCLSRSCVDIVFGAWRAGAGGRAGVFLSKLISSKNAELCKPYTASVSPSPSCR